MSDGIMVCSRFSSKGSVFPTWSVEPEARYKKQWLPGTITAPPGFDAITHEEGFSLRNVLDAAEVISFSDWSRQLAEILYLKRSDGNREELTKADREALIMWMAKNPDNPFVDALLDIKHPILFRSPFPDERILITGHLGPNLLPEKQNSKAYRLGKAIGYMVGLDAPDQPFHTQVITRYTEHSYYNGLRQGLGIQKLSW